MGHMTVRLYLDESGHSASHDYVIVAGLIGTAEAWRGFEERWNALLAEHGVVAPFHMTDFEAKQRQFKGWDEVARRRPLMKALMDEISDRLLFLCGAAISVQSFKTFDWETGFPGAEPLEDPYHLAMQEVIRECVQICNSGTRIPKDGVKLEIVMAEQPQFRAMAAAYYRATQHFDTSATLAPEVTFATPIECPPLQAADIAAFELRWRITRPDLRRYPWARLCEKGADLVHLRGIDAKKVFPERTFAPNEHPELVLKDSSLKRGARQ
jgi:hypothetical protein